jgi:hypothetical protein
MKKISNGKDAINLFFEEKDPVTLAEEIDSFINCFCFDKDGFVHELRIMPKEKQDKMRDYLFLWIIKLNWLKENNCFDLRNEYSVNTAEKLGEILEDELKDVKKRYNYEGDFIESKENIPFELAFTNEMSRIHRTLIQSFSSIVFECLLVYKDIEEKIKDSDLDEWFYKTPMI